MTSRGSRLDDLAAGFSRKCRLRQDATAQGDLAVVDPTWPGLMHPYKLFVLTCGVVLALASGCKRPEPAASVAAVPAAIIPAPRELITAEGQFVVTRQTPVSFESGSAGEAAARHLGDLMKRTRNFDLRFDAPAKPDTKVDNQLYGESREGVPQGGPLSPLLANITLDPLDKELEKRGHRFARYADDFTIVVKSRRSGERVLRSISQYLQSRLKLVVNAAKSRVVKTSESQFLGFTFKAGRIQWHPKVLRTFKQKVRVLTNRNWGVSMNYQLFKTSQYIRGWINYFGIANCYQLCVDLDHWIRRRVRMAYWRQWRKVTVR